MVQAPGGESVVVDTQSTSPRSGVLARFTRCGANSLPLDGGPLWIRCQWGDQQFPALKDSQTIQPGRSMTHHLQAMSQIRGPHRAIWRLQTGKGHDW